MQIHIYHDNVEYGPYDRETVLEYVKQGVFQFSDYGWHDGLLEWKPLGGLLGITTTAPLFIPDALQEPARPAAQFGRTTTFPTQPSVRMQPQPSPARQKKRTGVTALNLVLVLIAGAAAYIRFGNGGETVRRYLPATWALLSMQSPEAKIANAAPAPGSAAVEVTPVAAATPTPVATIRPPLKPFDPAGVAGNPAAWPKTLSLRQAVVFPAVYRSQVVGSVTVPRGSTVILVNIQGDQLTLEYQGGRQRVSWRLTDLEERVAQAGPVTQTSAPVAEAPPAIGSGPSTTVDNPSTSTDTPPGLGPQSSSYFGSARPR